ncbi:MAG: NUDIX hydrolase [Sandaracinaceae bacterium]
MSLPRDLDDLTQRLSVPDPRPSGLAPRAAVATVLRARRGLEALLIRRAEHEGDPWSGHMAFPGGRRDPNDPTLEHTAIRETHEEVALDLRTRARRLGRLDDVPTHRSGLVVRPVVFAVEGEPDLRPDPREVADVMWTPLEPLIEGRADTEHEVSYQGQVHRFPGYRVDGGVVWGLTYRMLQLLFERLRAPSR